MPEESSERFQKTFARMVESVGLARHFVRDSALAQGSPVDLETLGLLTDEIVTNAIKFGEGPVTVEVVFDGVTRVEVTDNNPSELPVLQSAPPTSTSGRGLALVERWAAAWGTFPREHGTKVVWFEMRPHDA